MEKIFIGTYEISDQKAEYIDLSSRRVPHLPYSYIHMKNLVSSRICAF